MDFEAIERALKEHFETVTPEEFRNNLQRACPYLFDSDYSNEDSPITSSNLEGNYAFKKMNFEAIDRALKEHFEIVTPEEFRNNLQRSCPHLFNSDYPNENFHSPEEGDKIEEEINSSTPFVASFSEEIHRTNTKQELLLDQEPAVRNPLEILVAEDAPMIASNSQLGSTATQKSSRKLPTSSATRVSGAIVGVAMVIGAATIVYTRKVNMSGHYPVNDEHSTSKNNELSTSKNNDYVQPASLEKEEQYKQLGSSLIYSPIEVMDKSGKRAKINVILLSSAYRWEIGSAEILVDSREKNKEIRKQKAIGISSLANYLRRDKILETIQQEGSINRVIAIGTASCEGDDILEEEKRAELRARSVIKLVEKELLDVAYYSIINLGQFNGGACPIVPEKTSWQRAIILLGVRQDEKGINLEEAVRERLSRIPVDLSKYTLGSEEKFKILNK
jgi:hypothetical protein